MPAATTRAALLAATVDEWSKLQALLACFDEASAHDADAEDTSAIRIVGHRAAWINLYFAWCKAAAAGDPLDMPAPGFKWSQLEALNAQIHRAQKNWTWDKAVATLEAAHVRLMDDINGATENELYGKPLAPGLKWTRGRYAEAAGSSHYRSARKVLRKILYGQDPPH